jgi:hypothetical protein
MELFMPVKSRGKVVGALPSELCSFPKEDLTNTLVEYSSKQSLLWGSCGSGTSGANFWAA